MNWWKLFKTTLKEAAENRVLGHSAELAYYFFLALFPLLICVLTFLTVFSVGGLHLNQALMNSFSKLAPGSASTLVQNTLKQVSGSQAKSKMSLGLIFSLWSASTGMSAMIDALNAELKIKERRGFIHKNAVATTRFGSLSSRSATKRE